MRTFVHFLLVFAFSATALQAQQNPIPAHRNCGAMEHLAHQLKQNPDFERRMQAIETHTRNFQHRSNARNTQVITIPTVVHVLYNNSTQNISLAQIQSQMQVLNDDFRRLNSDANNTWSQAADIQIEFCLASVDPQGNATNGITRTQTSVSAFGTNDQMKFSANGGKDAWPASEYLNIWVCNISGGILGYAQFPGSGAASTDGVVIGYRYFGTTGTAAAPFDGGRTTTHEVGHWLNLRHIWGDGGCSVDDFISDTPLSDGPNYGCTPSHTSCGSTDMVQNYMDYSDDACMNLFTQGQKDRMRALFASGGFRESLKNSNGCGSGNPNPTPVYCASTGQNSQYEWISNVSVGSFSNNSGAAGYSDFTSQTIDLSAGSSVSVNLTPSFSGTAYNEYWKIWIDYNGDNDFEDNGELVYSAGPSQAAVSGNFTVPNNASGTTRMRVSMKYNAAQTACESFSYGEVEDYTVRFENGAPVLTLPEGYCTAQGTNTSDEWIERVRFGTIDNTSGDNNGYGDFTAQATSISKGASQTITVTPAWSGQQYNEGYAIYVDWNRDGDFEDAGERAAASASAGTSAFSASITVPTSASTGPTKMRVVMRYNTSTPAACGSFTYGEVEDYVLNITASAKQLQNVPASTQVVDIQSKAAPMLSIFPNPAKSSVFLEFANANDLNGEVEIFDIQGRKIASFSRIERQYQVDVSGWAAGVYVVRIITSSDKVFTERFSVH